MVRTEALTKHFIDPKQGTVKAVDGITFEARPGEIVGLLGANGAGKTTALRMLSTVLRPTSGRAEVAGHDVAIEPELVRAKIGFLSNSTAMYGRLNPREALEYFAGLYGLFGSSAKSRIDTIIDRLQIGSYQDRLCDKLSTGQKQRVSIARAMLHDPAVLFFDEPTAGLDVVMSQSVMEFVEEQRDEGKTIIYCTHIMSEAERLCNRVEVIHEGKIRASGSVEQLKTETQSSTLEHAFLRLVEYKTAVAS